MVENRWQIAVGAVVLLLALLAGAFSVGVYVGRYGLTAQGLRLQPSDANRPAGNLPPGQGAEPALIGRLVQFREDGLDLATQQGRRFVSINHETEWLDPQGRSIESESLQPGDLIAIFGQFDEGGNRLLAERVVQLPPQPQGQ
jgi:hypothetical protein